MPRTTGSGSGLSLAAAAGVARIQRYGLHARLAARWGRGGDALWTTGAAGVLLAVNAGLAMAVGNAVLLASLGPIIFQLLERPMAGASSPRSTMIANAVALAVGYGSLAVCGLMDVPSIAQMGVDVPRALAVVLALAVTGGVLLAAGIVHPPAGSTTLLVTMGFVRHPADLLLAQVGIVVVVVSALVLNRAAGVPVPVWSPERESDPDREGAATGHA